jgi:hypothetical protein
MTDNLPIITERHTPSKAYNNVVAQCKSADAYLKPVEHLIRNDGPSDNLREVIHSEADISKAKRQITKAKQVWAVAGRVATDEEVAVVLGEELLQGYEANAKKAELAGMLKLLTVDLLDAKPCLYALVKACQALRQKHVFVPNIAEVMKALRKASRQAWWHEFHMGNIPLLEGRLAEAPKLLPLWRKQREKEEAKRVAELRRRAKDLPPEWFSGLYLPDELQLLGLDGDTLRQRRHKRLKQVRAERRATQ